MPSSIIYKQGILKAESEDANFFIGILDRASCFVKLVYTTNSFFKRWYF